MQRRAGAVTMRELSRNTASIIDRVREEDASVIVTRQGIPVATIQPLEVDPWARQPRTPIAAIEEEGIDVDSFELTEVMKELLRDAQDGCFHLERTGNRVGIGPGDTLLGIGRLELTGLAARTRSGTFNLTKTGRRVFEQLFG